MISARGPDSVSADEPGIDVRAPLFRVARQTPRPLHPVSACFGGGEQPRCRLRVQCLSLGLAPFEDRYGEAHHPASARSGWSVVGATRPEWVTSAGSLERLLAGARNEARECLLKVMTADRALARRTSGTGRFQPLGCQWLDGYSGTFETCRPTMRLSAIRGRPELAGARPKRRDWRATDVRWGIPVKSIGPLASLSNKQCDGLSVAEVLKRDIQ